MIKFSFEIFFYLKMYYFDLLIGRVIFTVSRKMIREGTMSGGIINRGGIVCFYLIFQGFWDWQVVNMFIMKIILFNMLMFNFIKLFFYFFLGCDCVFQFVDITMLLKSFREIGKVCMCQELFYFLDILGCVLLFYYSQEIGGVERGDLGQWKGFSRMGRLYVIWYYKFLSIFIVYRNIKFLFRVL